MAANEYELGARRQVPDALDTCVREQMERWHVPGLAIAVLRDGEVDARGFGVTNRETEQPVTPNTLFQIGSISKVFTATLIMRLVEEGLLDLDTPVASYLPDLRLADAAAQRSISLRHLLTHTSGLDGDRFDDYGLGDDALTKAVAEFHTLRQLTPPGELWTYCNTGFYLAGAVIERILDATFEAALGEQVFEPLGLERAFLFPHEAITYPIAVGHRRDPEEAPEIARPYPLPRCVNAAGGIISTVEELLRFAALHLGDGSVDGTRILTESSIRAMRTPQTPAANFADAYGLGWALRSIDGVQVVEHGGSTNGFQAQLSLVPERRFAVAVLTNSARGSAANRGIEDWALAHYCGLRRPAPPAVTLAEDDLARFAGHYRQPHADLTVTVEDGGLRIETVSRSPLTGEETKLPARVVVPMGAREFIVTEGEAESARVDFIEAKDGRPPFIRAGGRLAARVDDPDAGERPAVA